MISGSTGRSTRGGWPGWLVCVLGAVWIISLLQSLSTADEVMADGAGPSYVRYVDRELRLLDRTEQESGWRLWLMGYDAGGEIAEDHLDELRETLDAGAELGALNAEGHQARIVLALRDGDRKAAREADVGAADDGTIVYAVLERLLDGTEATEEEWSRLAEAVASGDASAWEVWLLREAGGRGAVDADVYEAYEAQNRRHAQRVIVAAAGVLVLTALGLGLVPFVFWSWKRNGSRREPFWPASRGVAAVLGTFFAVELAADLTMEIFWLGMSHFPWALPDGLWTFTWMWGDIVWRILPVAFMLIFLFRSPVHLWRGFRLYPQGAFASCFAAFSLLWLLQGGMYALAGDAGVTDPTDFLDVAEVGPGMVIFLVLSTCVVAPVTEEIMCRGVLFFGLKRHLGPWLALLISSVLFGIIHWQYDLLGIIGVTLMGVVSALLAWRTGSLYPSILLHALFNFVVTVHAYVTYQWPVV